MWINKQFFSKYSPLPLPSNYDYNEIMLYVPVAAEIWLRPLLGSDFYDELEQQITNNEVSDENAALLTEGLLWQYLCYATCYEGLPFLWSNISAVGITLGKSDSSDSITLKDLTYISDHLRRQTEWLKSSVMRYICEHNDAYPNADFCACNCDCCGNKGKLNYPNPLKQIHSTFRRCTDIK